MRGDDDCQHQGGREPGWNGKVNPGEPPINVVRTSKPKMLTGLSQQACGQVWEFPLSLIADRAPPANRRDLPHSDGTGVKRGKPVLLPAGNANRKERRWEGG